MEGIRLCYGCALVVIGVILIMGGTFFVGVAFNSVENKVETLVDYRITTNKKTISDYRIEQTEHLLKNDHLLVDTYTFGPSGIEYNHTDIFCDFDYEVVQGLTNHKNWNVKEIKDLRMKEAEESVLSKLKSK